MNENDLHWYALKVFFNKVFGIDEQLKLQGIETYFPTEKRERCVHGVMRQVTCPMIASLLFFRTTETQAIAIERSLSDQISLYSHITDNGRRPVAIPDHEMNMFMLVASSGEQGIEVMSQDTLAKLKIGSRVRVTDGPFKGSEGNICRIRGRRRMIVSIRGVCTIVTTYIPNGFLQPLDSEE